MECGITSLLGIGMKERQNVCRFSKAFLALSGKRGAGAIDSLKYSWRGETIYVFSPVQLIPRELQGIIQVVLTTVVMVVPECPSHPWWNQLQQLMVRWLMLGVSETVLKQGPPMPSQRVRLPPRRILIAVISSRQ